LPTTKHRFISSDESASDLRDSAAGYALQLNGGQKRLCMISYQILSRGEYYSQSILKAKVFPKSVLGSEAVKPEVALAGASFAGLFTP
jgi:hypothetical protein